MGKIDADSTWSLMLTKPIVIHKLRPTKSPFEPHMALVLDNPLNRARKRTNGDDETRGPSLPQVARELAAQHAASRPPAASRIDVHALVARNLVLARHALHVTQESLAESSGVSR